jgi:hypothetical protein
MWQILDPTSLPSLPITSNHLLEMSRRLTAMPLPMKLFGKCFDTTPSKRPNAAEVAQRLLDEYNDRCAEFAPGAADVETIVAVKTKCWDLLKACRNQYWDKQKDYGQVIPGESLGDTETSVLFQSLESWSEPASLTLAPEMHFLIGSGIFWGFINSQRVDEETPMETPKSPLGKPVLFPAKNVSLPMSTRKLVSRKCCGYAIF